MNILAPDNSMKLFFLIAPCLYLVNLLISSLFAYKYEDSIYKKNFVLWLCYLLLSVSQGLLTEVIKIDLPTKTLIWSFFAFIGMQSLSQILADIFRKKSNIKADFIYYSVGLVLSSILLNFFEKSHFNLAVFPAILCSAWPILKLSAVIKEFKLTSFTKIGFFISSFLTALHILDYAYAADKPELMFPGYLVALILSTGISCFSFAVLIERAIYEVEVKDLLHNTSRLAALGGMAAEIAHEVNNPLSILSLNNYQLRQKVENGSLDNEYLIKKIEVSEKMTDRLIKIIQGLKTSYRSAEKDSFKTVNLSEIFEDVRVLCEMKSSKLGVSLTFDRIFNDVSIDCRPVQITQILQNIVYNALDALDGAHEKWIKISFEIKEHNLIEIYVKDSGPGISKENREKIFSTFFTTKPNGQGTGLGLSISKRFSEEHKGFLKLDSDSEQTTFILGLPLRQKPDPTPQEQRKAS